MCRRLCGLDFTARSTKPQLVQADLQPNGQHTQFVLGRNGFSQQPIARCVRREAATPAAKVELVRHHVRGLAVTTTIQRSAKLHFYLRLALSEHNCSPEKILSFDNNFCYSELHIQINNSLKTTS
jgi:hypothetical protein